jgi:hypothetical protein
MRKPCPQNPIRAIIFIATGLKSHFIDLGSQLIRILYSFLAPTLPNL